MRVQFARRSDRCAFPPIGSYIEPSPFKRSFEAIQIKDPDGFVVGPLRPEGSRQPQAEAAILGNLRARAQGRAAFPDACIEKGGYK